MGIEAAVAVIVDTSNKEYKILFIRRRIDESDPWSGHIAFPGGRRSGKDENLIHVVYREVLEEVGLKLYRDAIFLARLRRVYPRNAPWITVYPYVFKLFNPVKPMCGGEVEEFYWIPLWKLSRKRVRILTGKGFMWRVAYVTEPETGRIIIWGMTRRILDDFIGKFHKLF